MRQRLSNVLGWIGGLALLGFLGAAAGLRFWSNLRWFGLAVALLLLPFFAWLWAESHAHPPTLTPAQRRRWLTRGLGVFLPALTIAALPARFWVQFWAQILVLAFVAGILVWLVRSLFPAQQRPQ